MLILSGGRRTVLVNTGFPNDATGIAKAWADDDPRCVLVRTSEMRIETILAARNIDPLTVYAVFLTPWGTYNSGNISRFANAAIYALRRGWAYLVRLELDLPPPVRNITIPDAELFHLVTDGTPRFPEAAQIGRRNTEAGWWSRGESNP